MYKYPFNLNNKQLLIEPYNTEKEKDLLIMSSFGIYEIDEVLRVLGISEDIMKLLSENEKKVLLYKFREISVGDEINIKFKCSECKHPNESSIIISDLVTNPDIKSKYNIKQLDKPVNDDNLHLFIDLSIEELMDLDIDEYEELIEEVKSNQVTYKFTQSCTCIKCKKPNLFSIGDIKYIIESLSEDTLMSMYKTYNDMSIFGNYTKRDIDSLYPFERTILIGLINKTREEMKK